MPPSLKMLTVLRPRAIPLRRSMPLLAQQLHYRVPAGASRNQTPHSSNLRNTTIFPSFTQLAPRQTGNKNPIGHWCFLAEIVHLSWFLRLCIGVHDTNATSIPVFLYTPDRGAVLVPNLEEGHTLAVFYGTTHVFADGVVGMRVEDPKSINVLPHSLDELMDANDKIFEKVCANCGKPVPGVQQLGHIPYCDKICRKTRTTDRSALRAVSRLLQRDWESESHAGALHLQPPSPWAKGNPQFGVTDPNVFRALLGLFPPTYHGPLKDLSANEIEVLLAREFTDFGAGL